MKLITLLTDFGTTDAYVAEMKGRILSLAPEAQLVDVSHTLAPGDVRAAAYIMGRVWQQFPEGTVHLAVVDPGVGTDRHALAVSAHGHFFIGPDNGILSSVIRDARVSVAILPIPDGVSSTFHGRDVFAPAAAALSCGSGLGEIGEVFRGVPVRIATREPYHEGKTLIGEVIYVDRFGTLVTNFTAENLPDYASVEIEGVEVGKLRRTYGDVPTGGLVAYLGSAGDVEIAVRDGSAARR
ncbi:MAG TPA: SAM-dependent chlorinase/fluorinase, partial [Gemmatimonadales bacterium]|nr:SAM-dependent chlorinase/fluorinase [Gemmatimonadales bacterium]